MECNPNRGGGNYINWETAELKLSGSTIQEIQMDENEICKKSKPRQFYAYEQLITSLEEMDNFCHSLGAELMEANSERLLEEMYLKKSALNKGGFKNQAVYIFSYAAAFGSLCDSQDSCL